MARYARQWVVEITTFDKRTRTAEGTVQHPLAGAKGTFRILKERDWRNQERRRLDVHITEQGKLEAKANPYGWRSQFHPPRPLRNAIFRAFDRAVVEGKPAERELCIDCEHPECPSTTTHPDCSGCPKCAEEAKNRRPLSAEERTLPLPFESGTRSSKDSKPKKRTPKKSAKKAKGSKRPPRRSPSRTSRKGLKARKRSKASKPAKRKPAKRAKRKAVRRGR